MVASGYGRAARMSGRLLDDSFPLAKHEVTSFTVHAGSQTREITLLPKPPFFLARGALDVIEYPASHPVVNE